MRKILLTSLALAVAATPALADRGADQPADAPKPPKHEHPEKAKGPKGTHHLLHACVVNDDATESGVDLSVLGGNRHMRRVLDGAELFTAKLDGDTIVRLVGKARHLPEGSTPKRLPKIGSYADLEAGDRVIVRFRAERGLEPGELPAAFKVIDRGPSKACTPGTPPEDDDPKDESPQL